MVTDQSDSWYLGLHNCHDALLVMHPNSELIILCLIQLGILRVWCDGASKQQNGYTVTQTHTEHTALFGSNCPAISQSSLPPGGLTFGSHGQGTVLGHWGKEACVVGDVGVRFPAHIVISGVEGWGAWDQVWPCWWQKRHDYGDDHICNGLIVDVRAGAGSDCHVKCACLSRCSTSLCEYIKNTWVRFFWSDKISTESTDKKKKLCMRWGKGEIAD